MSTTVGIRPETAPPRRGHGAAAESDIPVAPALDPRVPDWSTHGLLARACPLCQSNDYTSIVRRSDTLLVGSCGTCGLCYLPLMPTHEALAAFYQQYSKTHQEWASKKNREAALRAASRRHGGNRLLHEIGRRRPLRGTRLLEIGCSTGSFLLDARNSGVIVAGVEIDHAAREFVTRELGIPCHGTIEAAFESGDYDIIVALNVIEHLPDPRGWLDCLQSGLRPGGLFVVWTPNAGQVDTLGAGWIGFRVDFDHLTYFSARTLGKLLGIQAGRSVQLPAD
jgi:2-polyprenyl-3-methyl-5-hydroxy-6-metoxy-1,4-benzoquinol methylase